MIKLFIREFITEKYGNGLDIVLDVLLENGWELPGEGLLDLSEELLSDTDSDHTEDTVSDGNGEYSNVLDWEDSLEEQLDVFN